MCVCVCVCVIAKRPLFYDPAPPCSSQLDLHYSVNCDRASAKFEKTTQVLTVTLPVLPSTLPSNDLSPPVGPPQEGAGLQEDEGECNSPEGSRKDGMYTHTHTSIERSLCSYTLEP